MAGLPGEKTSQSSTIRTDLLIGEHTEPLPTVRFELVYDQFVDNARSSRIPPPLRSVGSAKELDECFKLIKKAIDIQEEIQGTIPEAKLKSFGWQEPVEKAELEAISILPTLRLPGALSAGRPTKSREVVRERVPHLREEGLDAENHNYRVAILGRFYDNWVDFTCWGRTNKGALDRSIWFEDLIADYAWYFTSVGISRIMVEGTKARMTKKVGDNVIYGYPVEVFIRTEKIKIVSSRALQEIIVKIGLANS
jgi:hypothetical protein